LDILVSTCNVSEVIYTNVWVL